MQKNVRGLPVLLAAALCAVLCWPAQAVMAEETLRASSGTGGTQPRMRQYTRRLERDENGNELPDARGQAAIDRWLEEFAPELDMTPEELRQKSKWEHFTDEVLAVYDYAQYDPGLYSRVYDLGTGEALRLSDMFYDGFDYAEYINTYLTLIPRNTNINSYYENWVLTPKGLARAFSDSFSASTLFVPRNGVDGQTYLQIIPPDNFKSLQGNPEDAVYFALFVPITHDMSPWGGCKVDVKYQETATPSGMRLLKPVLRIDDGVIAKVEEAINASLEAMLPEALKKLDALAPLADQWVQPTVSVADHYAAVCFTLMESVDIWEEEVGHLAGAVFDLHTGDPVADIMDWTARCVDHEQASIKRYDHDAEGGSVLIQVPKEQLTLKEPPFFQKLYVRDGAVVASFFLRSDHCWVDVPLGIAIQDPAKLPAEKEGSL